MQTFLPCLSFEASAQYLDRVRLNKQRVEASQILDVLMELRMRQRAQHRRASTASVIPWENHPAVVMWEGYEHALCRYGMQMCIEHRRRGYQDSLLGKFIRTQESLGSLITDDPWWLTPDGVICQVHQALLHRKNTVYYKCPPHLNWIAPGTQIWPCRFRSRFYADGPSFDLRRCPSHDEREALVTHVLDRAERDHSRTSGEWRGRVVRSNSDYEIMQSWTPKGDKKWVFFMVNKKGVL